MDDGGYDIPEEYKRWAEKMWGEAAAQVWEEIEIKEDAIAVELWYPQLDDRPIKFVEVGLCDTRAADSLRMSYDFDRDGWKIEQASTFSWPSDDKVCNPDWQEVAFVKAWAREKAGK